MNFNFQQQRPGGNQEQRGANPRGRGRGRGRGGQQNRNQPRNHRGGRGRGRGGHGREGREPRAEPDADMEDDPEGECVVCNLVRRNVVLMQCGDIICNQCANEVAWDTVVNNIPWECPRHQRANMGGAPPPPPPPGAPPAPPVIPGQLRLVGRVLPPAIRYGGILPNVAAEFVERDPIHQLLPGYEKRVLQLLEWSIYGVPDVSVRGLVNDDYDYGEEQQKFGYYKHAGIIMVILPKNVVNTMLAWWQHRAGGKTKENFIISVIYMEQLLSNVSMPSSTYLIVKNFVPVVAYLDDSDMRSRRILMNPSWKSWLFKNHKLVGSVITVALAAVMFTRLTTKIKHKLF